MGSLPAGLRVYACWQEKAGSQLTCKKAGAEAAGFLWPIFFYYVFSLSTDTKAVRIVNVYGEHTMSPVFFC